MLDSSLKWIHLKRIGCAIALKANQCINNTAINMKIKAFYNNNNSNNNNNNNNNNNEFIKSLKSVKYF